MTIDEMKALAIEAAEDLKAEDISVLDVTGKTSVTDWIIIVTGSSSRHVKAIANSINIAAKEANKPPLGIEGEDEGEWVLVDMGDVIVHVMQRQVREYYDLESLWSVDVIGRGRDSDAGGDEKDASEA